MLLPPSSPPSMGKEISVDGETLLRRAKTCQNFRVYTLHGFLHARAMLPLSVSYWEKLWQGGVSRETAAAPCCWNLSLLPPLCLSLSLSCIGTCRSMNAAYFSLRCVAMHTLPPLPDKAIYTSGGCGREF